MTARSVGKEVQMGLKQNLSIYMKYMIKDAQKISRMTKVSNDWVWGR